MTEAFYQDNILKKKGVRMYISFEDFSKLSLKVGAIKEVSPHPNADKLYVLKVSLGDKEIQLVAGIRKSYSPEELLNKQIVVLENLEPKVIRGVKSEGMLLAVCTEEGPVILIPEKKVIPGLPIA
ncbi:MAG: hypothetical protein DRP61_04115 [Candidatus Omnitrophota bacterium]|nr:MAG: hypothetical protein DRP61_04115 [Candidatus Omnitrophota bacterium]RKY35260.1 MAG: hypothetical protein DRP69_02235 [Candidatus Omnitrophota bacterium]RKY43873.1 MAG: hypothetical protein DRP80_03915 [Candidatus Omnitrophota bacterium]